MKSRILSAQELDRALAYLEKEEVVAIPTETVYGLAGDATSDQACQAIFRIKGRSHDNPLISHFADPCQLVEYGIALSSMANDLLRVFSPGPLTLVLPAQTQGISAYATAGLPTIAVRFPAHPLAKTLLERFNKPLVAPSANLSGRYSSTTAEMVWQQLGDKIPAILDGGACQWGLESTVILVQEHQATLLRYGSLPYEAIAQVIGKERLTLAPHLHHTLDDQTPILSPGVKYAHYQPYKPLHLFRDPQELATITPKSKYALLALEEHAPFLEDATFGYQALFVNPDHYANALYSTLAQADNQEVIDTIVAYYDPCLGDALMDRLRRSAQSTFLSLTL